MQNKHLKETMIQEEKLFKNWELYLKNLYFGSKIQESYLRSFPKIPKSFTTPAAKTPMFDLNYASNYSKFTSSLVYPEHLQYSEDFIYIKCLNIAKEFERKRPSHFSYCMFMGNKNLFQSIHVFGVNYSLEGEVRFVLGNAYRDRIYIKKELLRKIFLFTLEGYLSETNGLLSKYASIHIDFETYDDWPINDIKFTQEYKNSGKLCREFFDSVAHIKF